MNTYLSTSRLELLKRLLFLFMLFISTVFVNREAWHNSWRNQYPCAVICTQKLTLYMFIFNLEPLNGIINTLCTFADGSQYLIFCKCKEIPIS